MADYLDWQSEVTLDNVFADGDSFSYPEQWHQASSDERVIVYLTQLRTEKGRSVLMLKRGQQEAQCITPLPFNLRTKISEYGGKPFWLLGDEVFFCHHEDQCIYRQTLLGDGSVTEPQRVSVKANTVSGQRLMYTDLIKVSDSHLLAIVEYEDINNHDLENRSAIACLDISQADTPPQILIEGADFYSNLVYHPAQQHLAWVQWQHPCMPWDENELWVAKLGIDNEAFRVSHSQVISLPESACVCSVLFAANGKLFFSADFATKDKGNELLRSAANADYWNVLCYTPESQKVVRVTDQALEFGYPHWQYGDARLVQFDEQRLLTIGSAPQGDTLFLIDQDSLSVDELSQPASTVQQLSHNNKGVCYAIRLLFDGAPQLISLQGKGLDETLVIGPQPLSNSKFSVAEHIDFVTRDGEQAHGFYYPPSNRDYTNDGPAPLIVLVHGGPTARAYGHFDIQKQFWTSRGFALFDVNHRGSSGYGRAYRDALYDHWGERDASDIIDGIDHLIRQHKVDSTRVCIRGKSAGGYAVLRALTEYPDAFRAGACYYGIGNLATLAQTTHKFEKYYTDRLIGESYDVEAAKKVSSRFYQRSPVHKLAKLNSAMIVFQGLQDKVVPPAVAQEVIAVLSTANIDHAYHEYADEGHGFRQVANNIDAWTHELAFYRRVLVSQ